jgi:hypothetical protein
VGLALLLLQPPQTFLSAAPAEEPADLEDQALLLDDG